MQGGIPCPCALKAGRKQARTLWTCAATRLGGKREILKTKLFFRRILRNHIV